MIDNKIYCENCGKYDECGQLTTATKSALTAVIVGLVLKNLRKSNGRGTRR